ncbi:hypothetical protein [Arenivirga flava]|uniref:ABC transporter ATP-binding protein n=1 Tax=Arenivirga flava TaxID=1930060 RepID=A0AA37UQX8_9MICO|nr:hypothetical protein [Arenivirga flava]GMA26767.1 ABC transporter ATP-binding protein [Arenivirga flava]GMA29881.1 ABC transporter ATP-binding protein [Arenivirga flava]GMA29990.1 ABC transporter ATP-binding protein [Arenivirga flava]
MVAHLLRLRLSLFANNFKRSPWQVVGLVVGLLYGGIMAVVLLGGLIALRFAPLDIARPAVVLGGALVLIGALVVPLLMGSDDDLDPRRFALFGIPLDRLVRGLFLAGLVAIPSVVLALAGIAQIVTWSRDPLALALAIPVAALVPLAWVLGARLTTSIASLFLSTRRAREWTGIIALLLVLMVSPVFVLLGQVDWSEDGADVVSLLASIAGWTPFGAVWAAPADAAAGLVGPALLKLLIGLAYVALLWFGWRAMVARMLSAPDHEGAAKEYSGLGWFDRMPGTPTGVIAARSFVYWLRDPRYRASLLVLPIVPIVMIVPLAVSGVSTEVLALIPVPMIALFLGWSLHDDVAFDSTAFWMHVASNVTGRADRFGRLVPALTIGLPVVLLGSVVSAWVHGDWSVLGSILGVSLFTLLWGLGLSSVMSAAFPYPVVRPGDNPFTQPQSGGGLTALLQSLTFLGTLVAAVPVIVLAALGLFLDPGWHVAALIVGAVLGGASLVGGVVWGARIFERRAPELLAFTIKHD